MIITGKETEVLAGKCVPMPLSPLQIPHGIAWDRSPATNRLHRDVADCKLLNVINISTIKVKKPPVGERNWTTGTPIVVVESLVQLSCELWSPLALIWMIHFFSRSRRREAAEGWQELPHRSTWNSNWETPPPTWITGIVPYSSYTRRCPHR
jgi:hypothetical protein